MRVNVYAEELTDRVEVVRKAADTGAEFCGLRFFLESSPTLHQRPDDDDASAVTFWIPSSKGGFRPGDERRLVELLARAIGDLKAAAVGKASGERLDFRGLGDPRAHGAVYCLTPTTEDVARAIAKHARPEPAHRWELPAPEASSFEIDPDDPDDGPEADV